MDTLTPQPEHKTIIDYLIASTPIAIAIFVAVIGWLQWRTAYAKLQLDRYARRFEVYEVTVEFYNRLIRSIETDRAAFDALCIDFGVKMLESRYLFDSKSGIYPLLLELQMRSLRVIYRKTEMDNGRLDTPTWVKLNTLGEIDDRFINESMPLLSEMMSPYLSIRDSRYFNWRRSGAIETAKKSTLIASEIHNQLRDEYFASSPTYQPPASPADPATS